ncbi:glycosyltransferase family 4 protein [Lentisphaera profundi]|uniref:Glycosyltransferase family 4 protein n=1 Tax=Lentisphaera profundi TaxID=1658616 RepID=A0ABY7W202_9BACT|nr:glycosyltransferase family 4 protein [Lentisphaera profundi]WDE99147.1 glycosyltransferase family 4 protein [Lentisphaera profundi]
MSKNIWYCNHYALDPKFKNYRPYFLSSQLSAMGEKVTIIAASFHHLHKDTIQFKGDYCLKKVNGVNYLWIKTPYYKGNGVARIQNMLAYSAFLKRTNLVHMGVLKKPDVIVVSSVHMFHFKAMKKWAKIYDAQLIFEVRDIWPLTLNNLLKMSKYHPLYIWLAHLEKHAYKHANKVISVLPNGFEHMKKQGLDEKKYFHIPNGIEIPDEQKIVTPHVLMKDLQKEGKFIVFYCGTHGIPNALEPLIQAAILLDQKQNTKIHFVLLGKGEKKEHLINLATENSLTNVTFLSAVPKNEVSSYLKAANICYLGWQNTTLYRYGVSANKIFEYMLGEKPILQSINSPNNPVELAQCGQCIEAMNPEVIADALENFALMPQNELKNMGLKGLEYIKKNHDYAKLAQNFIEVIEK